MSRPLDVVVPCPSCGSRNTPISHTKQRENDVYRRRKCVDCGQKFSTTERPVMEGPQAGRLQSSAMVLLN